MIKAILNQNKWFNIAYTGCGTPVSYNIVGLKETEYS